MIWTILAAIVIVLASIVAFQAWKRLTVSGTIYRLTKSCEHLERVPTGDAKQARDRLVKVGRRALPALRRRNEQLLGEHAAYSAALEAGPSWNPYENYEQKSPAEWHYRYVIEIRQARVADVIEEIEAGASNLLPGRCRLSLPKDWHAVDSPRSAAGHMEFAGPAGSAIRFAIGPISPEPTVEEQQCNLDKIASKHGHTVLATGDIEVGGKRHATMTCEVPKVGILKHYSLIFDGIEYLVTARGDTQLCDTIVKTFRTA